MASKVSVAEAIVTGAAGANRADLLRAIRIVAPTAHHKKSIPILAYVLVDIGSGGVTFAASDLETFVESEATAEVGTPGQFAVPASRLMALLAAMRGENVVFDVAGDRLWIRCGTLEASLHYLPADDFPTRPTLPPIQADVEMPARDLAEVLRAVRIAICADDARYYLTGVNVEAEADGTTSFVATDGHRLACAARKGATAEGTFLVPRDAVFAMDRALAGQDGGCRLSGNGPAGQLAIGTTRVWWGQKEKRQFPQWRKVCDLKHEAAVTLSAGDLLTAMRQVSPMLNSRSRMVTLAVAPGRVTLAATSVDVGSCSISLPAAYEGKPMKVGFNGRYFQDALRYFAKGEVSIELAGGDAQANFLAPGTDGRLRYCYVLMPMRYEE